MFAQHFLSFGDTEIHVRVMGKADAPALLCVHGLTRTGHDFDHLEPVLGEKFQLILPDLPGRGLSSWSSDPKEGYRLGTYSQQIAWVLDELNIDAVHWLGTSLGGLIALYGSQHMLKGRILSLCLNDIGPEVPPDVAAAIVQYASQPMRFAKASEFFAMIKQLYAPFGIQDERRWAEFLHHSIRRDDDGKYSFQHDPDVVAAAVAHPEDMAELWSHFAQLDMPLLVVQGADSLLLTNEICASMMDLQPQAKLLRVAGAGHAPYLDPQCEGKELLKFFQDQRA